MTGPLAAFADTSLRHIPQFNAKSRITRRGPEVRRRGGLNYDGIHALVSSSRAVNDWSTITRRNRLTRDGEQLRLGQDGRWYPYRKTRNGWDPDGPPFEESELAR